MGVALSGLASGFDWQSLVTQLINADRAPETRMRSSQQTLQQQNSAYDTIKTNLTTLQTKIQALSDPSLFDSRTATSSDPSTASTTASPGAPVGTYVFKFSQMATAARQRGAANIAEHLSSTNDVSGVVLSNAGFSTAVTAGTFTVNGQQVRIATSDTLQGVFDKINAATGGAVTGSYDSTSDKVTLTSANEIVLGSSTDTSNFLQVAELFNNGAGEVTSASALSGVHLTGTLANANTATAISDGGSGAGQCLINGVAISFSTTSDSIQNVLDRINSSAAGVTATYDSTNNQFVLTNKTTGDTGIGLQDVTGNFLAATGLSTGTLEHGKNLQYTVNGGPVINSQSNTITDASSGLTGLTVTALQEGTASVTVASDTQKIKTAISDFLTAYNSAQDYISSQTSSTTDASGKVTAGILAGLGDADEIASKLRSISFSPVASASSSINGLSALGIDSNGKDDKLALTNSGTLDDALTNNLSAVKDLFTNASTGLAVQLNTYLTNTTGDTGILNTRQTSLTKQSADIDTQIADMERRLQDEQQRLTNSFIAMETAQSKSNQQLQFLQQRFGTSSG